MLQINFADVLKWATYLWCQKQPLCQPSHNHCQIEVFVWIAYLMYLQSSWESTHGTSVFVCAFHAVALGSNPKRTK